MHFNIMVYLVVIQERQTLAAHDRPTSPGKQMDKKYGKGEQIMCYTAFTT